MIDILFAAVLFFIAILVHEGLHLFVARYFGYNSCFAWTSAKSKYNIGVLGWSPGVKIDVEVDDLTKKELFYITISPIFSGFVFYPSIILVLTWQNNIVSSYFKLISWLVVSSVIGIVSAFAISYSDIKDYNIEKKYCS
jgi:hypothetical protein